MLERYGIKLSYFKSLSFLNETKTPIYMAIYLAVFVLTGGIKSFLIASIVALFFTIIVQRFALNVRQPLPTNAAVIITGCSTGIGQVLAHYFAEKGLIVFATVRKEQDGKALQDSAKPGMKGDLIPVIMDVCDAEQVAAAEKFIREEVVKRNAGILSLVNNAGYALSGFLETISQEQLKKQFDTNVFGLINVTNTFLPLIREQAPLLAKQTTLKPSIQLVASVAGEMTIPTLGAYCATKASVIAIGHGYRQELRKMGINCVIIQPGSIDTQFNQTREKLIKETRTNPLADFEKVDDLEEKAVRDFYKDAQDQFESLASTSGGSHPSICCEVIEEAMTSPNPLPRYSIGPDAQIGLPFIRWTFHKVVDMVFVSKFPEIKKTTKTD